jgi:alkylation response protein AidB-like acyl-CoA dehydrogenase
MGEATMPGTDIEQFRSEARAWLEANMEPRPPVSRLGSSDSRTPEEIASSRILQRKLFDGGWAGISYPKEYGGRGLAAAHDRAFRQEALGYVMPDFGGAGHVMFGAIGRSLLAHASPAFLQRHVPKLLSGEVLWCQFYSEPAAGSDLAGIRTSATRDGDRWILRGSKIWSTGANHADYAMCLARTDWNAPKHRGLTWFAVPTNAEGLTIRTIVQINGAAGFCEEFLDDVEVADDDIIGEVNMGWTVAQTMLVYERGAGDAGPTPVEPRRLAPDLVALAYKVGRASDPVARQLLARAHANDYAQFHLGRRVAARLRSSQTPDPAVAAYGKLASGTLAPIRARIAVEIAGVHALGWDADDSSGRGPATDYLNGRMGSIAAGTNEMQRNGIGERVLGLPREPSFDSRKPFAEVVRAARDWDGRVG